MNEICKSAPTGWRCARPQGHPGPCSAAQTLAASGGCDSPGCAPPSTVSRALTDDDRSILDQAAEYLDESAESIPGSSEGEGRKASAHVCREMSRMNATPLTDLERAELNLLRYTSAQELCSPKVSQLLGPMTIWSEAGLIAHIARQIRMGERRYHDALQRVGTALGLPAGSDITKDIVPAIEALKSIEKPILSGAMKVIIENLRVTHGATTPGKWQRGDTSHQTVSVRDPSKPPYRIADFHHADDASFCDLAHRHIIEVLDALEAKGGV